MIHGYHVILPMYAFWLPNDPPGSWSDFVRRWEIARFGRPLKMLERKELNELTEEEMRDRAAAKAALSYPLVSITGEQALTIARGFGLRLRKATIRSGPVPSCPSTLIWFWLDTFIMWNVW